jgi:hypothetical protein
MAPAGEVSFELERFEWTADDRLEVVGRWIGVRGRRVSRPALTVDAGGRRHRVSGATVSNGDPEASWRASFAWSSARGEIAGAELEVGRSLVVELPPPRRRRRRSLASAVETDLRAEIDQLRAQLAELRAEPAVDAGVISALRAEAESARSEADRLTAELEALRAERDEPGSAPEAAEASDEDTAGAADELAGLRLAYGSLRAAHEKLEDEVESLLAVRDERDELAARLEQLRGQASDEERERANLGELIRDLQQRAADTDAANERLTAELAVAREDVARLQGLLAEREEAIAAAEEDATRRVEGERAATTEVHARLATAREEAQRTVAAEAAETERLRAELERSREDADRLLAAERAEVARLREELLSSETEDDDDSTRRMLERVTRDLERERATARQLRRELDALHSESAETRRTLASGTDNGALGADDAPPAATAAGRAGRAVRTAEGTQRRVEAARYAAAQRVPRVPPSPISLWAVRIIATLVVAALGIALVILIRMVT